jgi:hypothetical protein
MDVCGSPSFLYSEYGYAHIIIAEKNTISMQIASAFSPSAMFVAVQYFVA